MSETYLDDAGEKMVDQIYRLLPDSLTTVYDTLFDYMSAPATDPENVNHLDTIEDYVGRFDPSRYLEG